MISESLVFWALLIIVSVYDVDKHRIPNKVLILFLLLYLFLMLNDGFSFYELVHSLTGAVVLFSLGLILYFLRAMSAGDVKFLGVIGLYVGWGSLLDVTYYILIASGVIGAFYLLYNRANNSEITVRRYLEEKLMFVSGISPNVNNESVVHSRYSNKVTMPFAPSVVIGLAMYSYFT
ncbi:A24 family peptidase [Vibrio toranzoniae]|uniref:A24 family peptidase n=1 Tax=Vibrio toranzoniae TaxID=1194427 RepID=UPI0013767A75|nr:A24 family peptidase [Vibrio toranzoniae]NAZ91287.1 prepilin peptidase [Vibrio toranzoniae]NAZ96690.1 prepilin peptidase [Vibrio toranzoniae]